MAINPLKTYNLNGTWKATGDISTGLEFVRVDYDDSGWTDIEVPGHWQECPAFADYPEQLIYRRQVEFDAPRDGHRYFLRMSGVFYFCRVWFNGKYLGEHNGWFAPFEFEITDVLEQGANCLVVFARCLRETTPENKKQVLGVFGHWSGKPDSVQPGGIWNDVEIVETGRYCLADVRLGDYAIDEDEATAVVRTGIICDSNTFLSGLKVTWKIAPHNFDGETVEGELPSLHDGTGDADLAFQAVIPEPRLWWPREMGEPNLYTLELALEKDGEIIDSATRRFGLRSVEMKDWTLFVNGERTFCRGVNYAPCDIRIARADRDAYERDIDMILGANANIVQVHAHIEKTEFYELCDEKGLLVWQDFPLKWHYRREILDEALKQAEEMVELLSPHPSVAVWCCHNEPFKGQPDPSLWEAVSETRIPDFLSSLSSILVMNWNRDRLDNRLAGVIGDLDDSRPVVRASGIPGIMRDGTDAHLYFGWYVGTMRMLKAAAAVHRKTFRFVSEFGAQSFPSPDSFRKIQDVETVDEIDWRELERDYLLQKRYMDRFAPPRTTGGLDDYIGLTQWYQARLIRYYAEYLRRIKYDPCGGAMVFSFNDCCPAVSFSVADYWREPKAAYSVLAECFRPLHVMADMPRRWYPCGEIVGRDICVVNDYREDFHDARVRWAFFNQAGDCLSEGIELVDIPADSSVAVCCARWESADAPAGGYALVLELTAGPDSEPVTTQYEFELRARK